jgi:hypothetical protein
MSRDPEASALFRLVINVVMLAGLLALGFVGPDVEDHNRAVIREYVNGR